jgi:hypothetical protein
LAKHKGRKMVCIVRKSIRRALQLVQKAHFSCAVLTENKNMFNTR